MNKKKLLIKAFKKKIDESDMNWCNYCTHDIVCGIGRCPHFYFIEDIQNYQEKPAMPDYVWSCMDLSQEECPLRKISICGNCNDGSKFKIDYKKLRKYTEEI